MARNILLAGVDVSVLSTVLVLVNSSQDPDPDDGFTPINGVTADAEILDGVVAALQDNSLTSDLDITVGVFDREVTLSGTVPTIDDALNATDVALFPAWSRCGMSLMSRSSNSAGASAALQRGRRLRTP
jgi:hypothetical protein